MSTILDTILARKREEVAARRQQVSQFELNTRAASANRVENPGRLPSSASNNRRRNAP